MVDVSQKAYYAIRAVMELARRGDSGPTTIAQIADAQGIPPKFLAAILARLRQAEVVSSLRGTQGGYTLAGKPSALRVAQVVGAIDGPSVPPRSARSERLAGREYCAFAELCRDATAAAQRVFDQTTIQDLLDREDARHESRGPNYVI